MTVITAHQPNFLPGLNVVEKIEAADAVIWLDEVQYSHGGWSNRNRMPDGSWLTVPVERETDMAPFNRVRISEHGGWRQKHLRAIVQHYGRNPATFRIGQELLRPYRLLVGLNLALLHLLLADSETAWHFQSHLDGGRPQLAVSDSAEALRPISLRLALMVAEIGGDVYLSGPSGRRYLDEKPFHERDIDVHYWQHTGSTACALERLRVRSAR